ncbi:MAG: 4-alpha-glucanotransferase [Bacilli bacterium]
MRGSGILLHISSLPNPYGIGTFGKEAYAFVDFLKKAGQKYWQVLPLGPTSYGDSPYQTFSAFAGNPYFIDLDKLYEERLLKKSEYQILKSFDQTAVDFSFQYQTRFPILKIAFIRFWKNGDFLVFNQFVSGNELWLDDYALFMAIKDHMPEGNWSGWDHDLKTREPSALNKFKNDHNLDIQFWKFLQFKFFEQWRALKKYANENGIKIIGDMPIYVAYDSSDVWANPQYWQLDLDLNPVSVAGVPPDYFAITGQLWGNPLYNYDLMEKEGYKWWIDRIQDSLKLFDVVRIDHFRGFEAYYSVPFTDKTAENGKWVKGPGMRLFSAVKKALGEVHIIAEDLGFLTEEVYQLLHDCGYPGMKIFQFGFDAHGDSEYSPHNYSKKAIVYTGTHDNLPIEAWIDSLKPEDYQYFMDYLHIKKRSEAGFASILECLKSVCDIAIIPMQDYLGLKEEARFNRPSFLGGNWIWRVQKAATSEKLAKKINYWVKVYRR